MLSSPEVGDIARTTVLFGLGFVPATVIGGLALATAVNSRSRWFVGLRTAYFLPVVVSLAAWTVVWRLLLVPDGPVNGLVQIIGLAPVAWLRDSSLALVALIAVQFLKSVGYSMVLFLAALQTVRPDLLEPFAWMAPTAGRAFDRSRCR